MTGADLHDWIGLRRVSDGDVTTVAGWWLEGGHWVPGYVSDALTRLHARRLVALGGPRTPRMSLVGGRELDVTDVNSAENVGDVEFTTCIIAVSVVPACVTVAGGYLMHRAHDLPSRCPR